MFAPRLFAVPALLLALAAPSLRAAEVDPHTPADTKSYFCVNVKQVLSSPLVKKHALDPARDALRESGADEVLKELGIDPFKDIDRVTMASPGGKSADRGLIIVRGTFDAAKITKAAENHGQVQTHKTPLGGGASHPIYEFTVEGQETSMFFALSGDKTLLASPGKDYVVDALKQGRAKTKVALKDKTVQQMIERMDDKQSVSFVVQARQIADAVGEHLPLGLRRSLERLEAIGGGLTVSEELKLDLAVATRDERSAQSLRETGDKALKLALVGLSLVEDNKQLGVALEVVKSVRIGGRGNQVTLTARLTADVLDDLFGKD